jgi:hypothetical protein
MTFAPLRYPDRLIAVQKHGRLCGQKEPKRYWDPEIVVFSGRFWVRIGCV